MKVIELNEGRTVEYELRGTKLDFADGTLTMNLAKYQRDYPVTKTITGDAEGNLLIDGSDSRFYVAEVEIPAIEYEDVEVDRSSRGHHGGRYRPQDPHRAQGQAAEHRRRDPAPVVYRRF